MGSTEGEQEKTSAVADQKDWFLIARAGDLNPEHSLRYRGAVMLYPSQPVAETEKARLVPPERQADYQVVPAKLFVGLENGWRIVPTELLAAMEKGRQKA